MPTYQGICCDDIDITKGIREIHRALNIVARLTDEDLAVLAKHHRNKQARKLCEAILGAHAKARKRP